MKNKIFIIVFVLLGLSFQMVGKNFSGQVDITSRYIWRGFDLLPDNNSAIQPSVTFELGDSGFALNIWGSFALTDRDIYKYSDEIDLTLTYAMPTSENISLVFGFINYGWWFAQDFKFEDNTTQEFFVELGFPKTLFSPKLTVYYDINLGDGLYVQASGQRTVSIGDGMNLDLSAALGYNGGSWLPKGADTGLSDLTVGAALPLSLGKMSLIPFVKYSFVFLDSVNDDNELWFGASLVF